MKAVLLTGHGGPEKLEYREDVPRPEPAGGEALIEVGAAGINNATSGPGREPTVQRKTRMRSRAGAGSL